MAATTGALATARRTALDTIARDLAAAPRDGRTATRAYAALADATVAAVHHVATRHLHPLPVPTEAERLAVLAVGGTGRAEMAPFSDVDLLFLTPWKTTAWAESVVESMLYMLWDLKLKVGHATRSVDDCLRLAARDMTIRTALLEHRAICGDPAPAEALRQRLWPELFEHTHAEFIQAKLDERDARHQRQGARYVLEPNVKEGKGGLRDLQTLYWIGKYLHRVDRAAELVPLGVFTEAEHATFYEAETFLWAVRCHLHLVAGRATETLGFDVQPEIAARMGYLDGGGRRAVERFMQDYFLRATHVGDLTRVFLTGLEARHLSAPLKLGWPFRRRRKLAPGFREQGGRLGVADEAAFLADPLNLLRLFEEGLRTGLLIHPDAMRLAAANLGLITEDVRTDPEARRIVLDLLLKHGNPERALRRMNELGVLPAVIPEFRPIVAMMQFNHYHHYTVDEHSIQCVAALAEIERGEAADDLPLTTEIMRGPEINRRVIMLAVLLHDIGKGRPEDHAILGAQLARRVCVRLGLPKDEVETVEWLVRNHLLMSDVAQKRDIADPRTLRDFARAVGTRKRLDLLLVLTVCDIRGVGPGVWNNWKAMLLRRLHAETARVLEGGLEEVNRERRSSGAKRALRHQLIAQGWEPKAIRAEAQRHYDTYWAGLPTETHAVFADLLAGVRDDEIRVDLHPDTDRDATRVAFVLADHPGLFSRMAGAIALVGANVVDARTYTTRDGWATAVFWVQDRDGRPYAADRLPRLREMIRKTLAGEVVARDALATRDRQLKKRERAFRFPTHVTFDNEGSDLYTIIEVDTRDRPGLLYDVTRTLATSGIQIGTAVCATFGAQVIDTFYVKDAFGLKLHQPHRREALERKLRAAIAEGAERAEG